MATNMCQEDRRNLLYNMSASSIQFLDTIGRGSFGLVKRATIKTANRRFKAAVKIFNGYKYKSDKESFENEIQILRKIEHNNVITLYGCYKESSNDPAIGIVLELMSCSLNDVLYVFKYVQYKCSQVLDWMLQCIMGVACLHEHSTIHRDLKPDNILLDKTFSVVKVSDFGTARFMETRMTVCQGSTPYMAPEVITGNNYDTRCDIYSIGIIIGELMTRRRPEKTLGTNAAQIFLNVPKGARPDISDVCCSDISKLITKCWSNNPKHRPFIGDVRESVKRLLEIRKKIHTKSHFIMDKEERELEEGSIENVKIMRQFIHTGVQCKYCRRTIVGRRYRCTECSEFDLCEKCSRDNKHNEHILFRFDRPYRDQPRYTEQQMLTMEQLTVILPNGQRLSIGYALDQRPRNFFLNFVTQKHLLELIYGTNDYEKIPGANHFGAYFSKQRQRLDVTIRNIETAVDSISLILQALDFNHTVVISAEEHLQQVVEAVLKTIILLTMSQDFRRINQLIFFSISFSNLLAIKQVVESTLFVQSKF